MLRSEYRDMILGFIGDTNRRYPQLLVNDLVKIERRNVVKWAKPSKFHRMFRCPTVVDQAMYNLSDISTTDANESIDEFYYYFYDVSTGVTFPLDSWSYTTFSQDTSSWQTKASGTPKNIIQYGRMAILSPAPDTANDFLYILNLISPPSLEDDLTVCTIPLELQIYVVRLAVAELERDTKKLQALEIELKNLGRDELNRARPILSQKLGLPGVNR